LNHGNSSTPFPISQAPRAYYAQFHGIAGVITKPSDHVVFLDPESSAVVTITEADAPHLMVLGEMASSTEQYISDMTAGGYAAIATSRAN